MLNAFFITENENPVQKEALLNDVKSQVKKLMEEAVVRSYVHEENTVITTLCASVEAILIYGLRQNLFSFFDDNSTLALCRRISKSCPGAQQVLNRMDYHRKAMHLVPKGPNGGHPATREPLRASATNGFTQPIKRKGSLNASYKRPNGLNGNRGPTVVYRSRPDGVRPTRAVSMLAGPVSFTPDPRLKTFWIRVALLEKVLDKIVLYLVSNAQRYYEKSSVIADPCDGLLVADLLRGPCAVDYSRTRTTDYLFTDPPVAELIQRHGISGSLRSRQLPYVSPSCQANPSHNLRSFSVQNLPMTQSPTVSGESVIVPTNGFATCSTPPSSDAKSLQNSRASSTTSVTQISESGSPSPWNLDTEPVGTPFSGPGSVRSARRKLVLAAKEHVESMHQGVRSTLLYGKNNVLMQAMDSDRTMPGYLSLHDYGEQSGLVLKWTPNWAMATTAPHSDHSQPMDDRNSLDVVVSSQNSPCSNTVVTDEVKYGNVAETQRDAYWKYAIKVKLTDLVYIHCHEKNDTYMIVFVRKDGIQLPPMTFYARSHLPAFLHCLEQSIESGGGFLDPRLNLQSPYSATATSVTQLSPSESASAQQSSGTPIPLGAQGESSIALDNSVFRWPRFTGSNERPGQHRPFAFDRSWIDRWLSLGPTQPANETTTDTDASNRTDPVTEEQELRTFRIVCADPSSGQLKRLSNRILRLIKAKVRRLPKRNIREQCANPQASSAYSANNEPYSGEQEEGESLEQSCQSISRTILGEAFRHWLACCRKLRILRSRLAGVVSPRVVTLDAPTNAAHGITPALWEQLRNSSDTDFTFLELCRHIYFGNCDPLLRRQVWPFLLGVYPWTTTLEDLVDIQQRNERVYRTALIEWQTAQHWVKDPDKLDGNPRLSAPPIPLSRHNEAAQEQNDRSSTTEQSDLPANLDIARPRLSGSHVSDQATVNEMSQGVPCLELIPATPLPSAHETTELDCRTPTGLLNGDLRSSADRTTRFDFDDLATSEQSKENSHPHSGLFQDSGTSVDVEFDDPPQAVTHEEAPYPDNIIDALGVNLYRIDKDVSRCDRNHYYFANPKKDLTSDDLEISNQDSDFPELNDNLNKLRNVICTWVWLHLDVGYIQGMCDLLAPLLVVLQDESLTYACFCRLMEWMLPNFPVSRTVSRDSGFGQDAPDSGQEYVAPPVSEGGEKHRSRPTLLALAKQAKVSDSIQSSPAPSADSSNLPDDGCSDMAVSSPCSAVCLPTPTVTSPYVAALTATSTDFMDLRFANLKALIEVFDPEMHNFLTEKAHETQFYFCYRWLLLDFKRELKYEDVFAVWEIIWASRRLVAYDFGLFFALALLQYYRDIILYYDMDLTEIIRFYNEMTEQHNTKALLDLARSLVFQMQNALHES